MTAWIWLVVLIAVIWALACTRAGAWLWAGAVAGVLAVIAAAGGWTGPVMASAWSIYGVASLLLLPTPLRRTVLGMPLLRVFRRILPQVSQTEQEALDAGTVWWEGDLFTGRPDWNKLHAYPRPQLTAEEQAFVDGPTEALCAMIDEWQVTQHLNDLPPHVWQFIKDNGFLGMIIPKAFGGKGFSALAHSEVVMKLTTRSGSAAVSVMVPNSLGPAELLLHYGTDAQKAQYLPRLARGLEIPCFALTSPEAGSDAGGIPDFGIVCRDTWQGSPDVLGIRLTWEKRYITLGPVATLLGLAFRLYDPKGLLGRGEDLGITLGLIPTDTPGVHIGRRHFPLNASFMNGPNWGKDVFIPMDYVIGGVDYVGQGWKMLMNCLAAGRSISLPSSSVGMAKLCARTTGAYGRVRTQFKMSIGRFEGVEEAVARIGGNTWLMDAARVTTAGAVDLGEKPSVISAIVKYHLTERGRQVVNDAMDVHGGKGICMGPSNYLGRAYQQIPIAITVEGANILTRSMIIFGQGAIRGHPYVLREIRATQDADHARASIEFDAAFFGHVAFVVSNAASTLWLGLTGARLAGGGPGDAETARYYRQLTRLSAAFAFTADMSMFLLGGSLKRKERLSARLGDILSQLYLASCGLKRHADAGRPAEDLPLLHWALQDALARAQDAFDGLFDNLPGAILPRLLRFIVFPFGRPFDPPSDALGQRVVRLLMEPGPARDRLTRGMYAPADEHDPVGVLDAALAAVIAAEPVEAKIRDAQRAGIIDGRFTAELAEAARAKGAIDEADCRLLDRAAELRRRVIMVDDFPRDFGPTEIFQTTKAVTFEALRERAA
jgi:acyl-CoA dehydrogenase